MDVQYRVATAADAQKLIEFLCLERVDESFKKPLSQRDVSIRDRVSKKFSSGFWIIGIDAGDICCCLGVDLDHEAKSGFCSTLAVDPDYRNRVIALAEICYLAVRHAMNEYGSVRFFADSWKGNKGFSRLMLAAGYTVLEEFDDPDKRPAGVKTVVYHTDLVAGGYEAIAAYYLELQKTYEGMRFTRKLGLPEEA